MKLRIAVWAVAVAACGGGATQQQPVASTVQHPQGPVAKPPASTAGDEWEAWAAKLGDPREAERALDHLEQLGNPAAIAAIGRAWQSGGHPIRMLQVIIALAKPLTPAEADEQFFTDYAQSGRPASWPAAQPYLLEAIDVIDRANPTSVTAAEKAAHAIGDAQLSAGFDVCAKLALQPPEARVITAQVAVIQALGQLTADRDRVAAVLVKLVDREPPPEITVKSNQAAQDEYSRFQFITASAVRALGELHATSATPSLVLGMYRAPSLSLQYERALVAMGALAEDELRHVLRGDHKAVNALVKARKLDQSCNADGTGCMPNSLRDFLAATALGAMRDPAAVPDLLLVFKRPMLPEYYSEGVPSPATQWDAAIDALRKLGAPAAAAPLKTVWTAALKRDDGLLAAAAVSAYPYVARGPVDLKWFAKTASDNDARDEVRQASAQAIALLSKNKADIVTFKGLAAKYLKAAKDKLATGGQDAQTYSAAYLGFARMFLTHIVRIDTAIRCGDDLKCLAATLDEAPDVIEQRLAPYLTDVDDKLELWTHDQVADLVVANIQRALLELGKRGPAAAQYKDTLLVHAITTDRQVREAILLALPLIAPRPCVTCGPTLDAVITADEGQTALGDLTFQTTLLRAYYTAP